MAYDMSQLIVDIESADVSRRSGSPVSIASIASTTGTESTSDTGCTSDTESTSDTASTANTDYTSDTECTTDTASTTDKVSTAPTVFTDSVVAAPITVHKKDALMMDFPKPEGEIDMDAALSRAPVRWSLIGQREANQKKSLAQTQQKVAFVDLKKAEFEAIRKDLLQSFKEMKLH